MNTTKDVIEAAEVIKNGGVILCPTDTICGLSADARQKEAVDKIFTIKQRPAKKSMIVLVSNIEMLKNYVEEIPASALALLKTSQRPTSIIYPKGKNLAKNVLASNGSIGIRIVQHGFCHELIESLGFPIVSSSANLSGHSSPKTIAEVREEIKTQVDLIVKDLPKSNLFMEASSIFLIEGTTLKQIR